MYGNGFIVIFFVIMIPVLLIVLGAILVIKIIQNNDRNNSGQRYNQALDILNQRYARGEITEDEYKQIKRTLNEK